MDTKLQNTETRREPWRIEERRIFAVNCYRIDWWRTFTDREAALVAFDAVVRSAYPGFYDAHADHRLVLVEDGAR